MNVIAQILNNIKESINQIIKELGIQTDQEIIFEIPRETNHGDYSTNIAMRLARELKQNPRQIAQNIVDKFDFEKLHLAKCEVAGPGFINFFLDRKFLASVILLINEIQENYGKSDIGKNVKINIEFVSANPTGYLHIGHGRGAAYGDSLARIYEKIGYKVCREHYVNDAGNQIYNLAVSIYERYKELFGLPCQLGEDSYHGPEIIEIAKKIKEEYGDKYLHQDYVSDFKKIGVETLLAGLRKDLEDFNVRFDIWYSEQSLYDNGDVERTLKFLQENNFTYEKDGAIWLKSSEYGDEKDRVLVKSDGTLTYLAPDIAYHMNKLSRGYDYLIDVLGADHHGYVPRLKAAIAMIGGNPNLIDVEILQMVRVIQNGEEIKMSKRSGKAITLRDLIDEVGTDALRFMYISKALSTHMDLDLDLAIKNSNENPVYYVQYAYARICSLFRTFAEQGKEFVPVKQFKKLDFEKNDQILLLLLQYPEIIQEAASKRLPHKIAQYTLDLAASFHSFYGDEKIITDDIEETLEKLTLLKAVQIVLKDALSLIGVGVKEKM
ncbi:MAG: arginine--tRNA ligase [Acholeplasmataceae bacterium]|nr:arginine--tRNA ligase [Acholeplasmataceae bacterium]HOA63389.1 arginine--tRNA ligase [Bacilli bacterium]HPT89118.1 arginine--tRNA ligase [Bacilli bacterium]HQD92349.1 arginine--tRNA ligase [Bacilli bacterium]